MTVEIAPKEAAHVLWMVGDGGYPPGGHAEMLLLAIMRADKQSLARHELGWPGYVTARRMVDQPGGLERLREIAAREQRGGEQ